MNDNPSETPLRALALWDGRLCALVTPKGSERRSRAPYASIHKNGRDTRSESMGTMSCIGYKGECGKVAYVICRYDGYLEHVGRILEEHYNDMEKVLKLLQGGDIVSLREDPKRIERVSPL